MKPEILWPLWVKDSTRFTANPLKDQVKLWLAIIILSSALLLVSTHVVKSIHL